jgi:hypothetical protein
MTVNELVEKLKNYPGDMRVLTLGYEGGYHDIRLDNDDIVFNVKRGDGAWNLKYHEFCAWYYGPHECVKFTDEAVGTPCLIVGRGK